MDSRSSSEIEISKRYEYIVYIAMWLVIFLLPVFNGVMGFFKGNEFGWSVIFNYWFGAIPYLVAFIINNLFNVPRYLFKGNVRKYLSFTGVLGFSFVLLEILTYSCRKSLFYQVADMNVKGMLGIPLPIFLYLATFFLLIGVNTAIALIFNYVRENQIRKSLENIRLQDELKFLKAQINPHFFMNMLNSIHGMIEINPEKAQEMTIEMSKLMRYVLYDGDNQTTTLADEVAFISSYIALFKRRFPEQKVSVELKLPENPSNEIRIPPLLFVSFVENAFKHGISYRFNSSINVSLLEEENNVVFECINTKHSKVEVGKCSGGVGLENVKRRLDLLYSDRYQLEIEDGENTYRVYLNIPSL